MAPQIKFYGGGGLFEVDIDAGGSGIGFYGSSGFGTSVSVGQWQGTTFVTNSNGTQQGPQITNIQWAHGNSGIVNGVTLPLTGIPNKDATLNIRFTFDSAVKLQNTKLYCYDRVNINNNPSGVSFRIAELIKPSITNNAPYGSGSQSWVTIGGSSVVFNALAISPGYSGLAAFNPNNTDIRHDLYYAMTCSPNSVGSKLFSLWISSEYL